MSRQQRLEIWLALWRESLPTARRKPGAADWRAAIERFVDALKRDCARNPVSWWMRVRLLYGLQKALAAQGVPGEALRPLALAIILRVYLA